MATRLLSSRSKALTFTFNGTFLNHFSSNSTRPLHSLTSPLLSGSHQPSDSIPPASRFVPKTNLAGASVPTAVSSLIGSNKINHISSCSQIYMQQIICNGMVLPRWPSSNAEVKPRKFSTAVKEEVGRTAKIEVTSFSPLEAAASVKTRSSGLGKESLKIKRSELFDKITFALIPALILTSKGSLTTSVLVLSVYWQIYGFFKEIFLDYVHQDVTRKWVFIYLQLLLLILAKDTFLNFGLV